MQEEADADQAIVDIEAAKRRAIVMHIQKRREMEREAEIKAADAAAKAAENWMGKFGDVVSADNIGKTLARAFEGAAGFMGALKSLASQVAGVFMSHMGGLLSTGLKTVLPSVFGAVATSVVPAAAAAGASAGVATGTAAATATGTSLLGGLSAVAAAIPGWGWAAAGVAAAFFFFKGWGGPSKAEQEARETFAGFHKGAVEALDL